jgi:hypothetical protein
MTDSMTGAGAEYNPFDSENFAHGGGLWDGKTVTITRAVCKTEALAYKDGKPVIDAKTGKQSIQTALFISGIAEGADDKERTETYSAGDRLEPMPDGEGFKSKDGGPVKFHANSNLGKLAAALSASGFDTRTLLVGGKQKFSNLVGARFVFKGEAKMGKDGKPILDKKGYEKNTFLPVKFLGMTAGMGGSVGAAGAAPGALDEKAIAAVCTALGKGPLTRTALVRTLATQLVGDPDANNIIGLVVRDDFHRGKPWKYDGTTASL